MVGVNGANNIYYRQGMSEGNPIGTGWTQVSGKLMMIEIYYNEVVGTNTGHVIYKCPVSGISAPKNGGNKVKPGHRNGNIRLSVFLHSSVPH